MADKILPQRVSGHEILPNVTEESLIVQDV